MHLSIKVSDGKQGGFASAPIEFPMPFGKKLSFASNCIEQLSMLEQNILIGMGLCDYEDLNPIVAKQKRSF